MADRTIKLAKPIPKKTTAVPCSCNGYADEVTPTKEEIKGQSCGKDYACCVKAFVCRLCKMRLVANLEAPEWLD